MQAIKRVLWVDDYPNNKVAGLFPDLETKKVSTMDDAIDEMSGGHLYDYDTIVFDIDFENGLPHGEKKILEKLAGKIYLSKDDRNIRFIIRNGGYLLFLYLLEKGYPSDQVAFLTGNPAILEQLKIYTQQAAAQLSREEIAEVFQKEWQECGNDIGEFEDRVDRLPINIRYKDSDFLLDCVEALFSGDSERLKTLIGGVVPSMVTGSVQNTGDKMIFRFHEANLEAPVYFSKNDDDIDGHNRGDAEKWLRDRRTDDNVTRWLLLSAADHIERLYRGGDQSMNSQVGALFEDSAVDPGVRSAFRQMFFVFDGRIDMSRRGVFYQALSAMLIPFDADIRNSGQSANAAGTQYHRLRRTFARVLKQARNYSAHNSFGSQVSNSTVLFLIGAALLAMLEKDQARDMESWFMSMYSSVSAGNAYSISEDLEKVRKLCASLLEKGMIDTVSAHVSGDADAYTPLDLLRALGFNSGMSAAAMKNSAVREKYYVFTLAAYVIRWFDGLGEDEVRSRFGRSAELMYRLAAETVAAYEYPGGI